MSAAGTPSTDPWVVLARERARYEEQFRALKPINGIVTGDQAKGFLLQSQLPPLVLGQIWGLADTDADGKMDFYEFSIACKLINLKLRGFEVPKALPAALLASLKVQTPPSIPPLPNPGLVNAPHRPEAPKVPQMMPPQPIMTSQPKIPPMMTQSPAGGIPTGIVNPMQNNMPQVGMLPQMSQPIGAIPPMGMVNTQPVMPPINTVAPMVPIINSVPPLIPGANIMPINSGASMMSSVHTNMSQMGPVGMVQGTNAPIVPPIVPISHVSPVGIPPSVPAGPGASSTPRASITSLDRQANESFGVEWSVPHQTKLKYTQIFNTTDRTRSGFLSGAQARNVMVQTKLPQNILAAVWGLSDMDSDGRLGCEEFVLAMHLCEQASLGTPPPTVLPPELIPPSFRRAPRTASRTASVSSQGSNQADVDMTLISQNSFEDKRKENFDKGQAELERRRKTLLDQQRKEAEERERKEREEIDKREKARLEAERKRVEELEKQMREQQEREKLIEEERKRQSEQRESARKEMERQRQLEWEKQRLQELQQQRQREQESVLKLKAKNQSLTIELTSINDQVKELSQKICDTRVGVSNVKSTIDGMRSTRDTSMQDMSHLKSKLKEQNAKLLQLSQEKVKLEAKNKVNSQINDNNSEQTKLAYENKEINIKNLKEKIEDMQTEIDTKMSDIENNNSQLTDLKTQLSQMVNDCAGLYAVYEQKRETILEMKGSTRNEGYSSAWGNDTTWKESTETAEWPVAADDWSTPATAEVETPAPAGTVKYRALYEFVARNNDEISFQPGDTVNVPLVQTGEPGWLAGEIRGHTGWFPESYVEPAEGVDVRGEAATVIESPTLQAEDIESKRLEGIAEVPETIHEVEPTPISAFDEPTPIAAFEPEFEIEAEEYIASFPYQSVEQGDLTFNAGETVLVIKKDGEWWTGKVDDRIGIFPSNYVQKTGIVSAVQNVQNVESVTDITTNDVVSAAASVLAAAQDNSQIDNEVSQINENQEIDKQPDFSVLASSSQTIRGGKKPEIASVIAPYQATSPEQLSLERGQLIMIRKKTDSGWWEGELQAKGRKRQVGWFPASYVKVLNSSGRISGRTTPVSATRMQQEMIIDKVVALYPYTAANPDELSFLKDDIISVTAREEQAWWRGELNGVSGLFPSNYVSPLQQSFEEEPRSNKKRKNCIKEFIQTEKAYIEDMSVVHRVFEVPLIESRVISQKDIDAIFVNWQDILQCNKNFLEDLLNRSNSGSDIIGDVICQHLPRMTAYITFCNKQLESAALLQNFTETSAPFREVVRRCQSDAATKGMPLSSFLIKPMQRITKYPLLISKILDNTSDNHADFEYLKEALQVADNFLKRLNENVRQKENQERLEWLQIYVQNDLNINFSGNTNKLGARRLIHFGLLSKVKSGKDLVGFLLNDFLLLVQPNKTNPSQFTFQKNNNVIYKIYRQPLLIHELRASKVSAESVENGTDANRVLRIQDSRQIISLLTPSVNECSLWLKRIEATKDLYEKCIALTKPRPKTRPTGITYGRLLVHVHKGKRFINAGICPKLPNTNRLPKNRKSYNTKPPKRRIGKAYVDNIYCKVILGDIEQNTDVAKDNMNGNVPQNGTPQPPTLIWNYSMQFPIKNVHQDILTLVVYEMCPFSPDEFLGCAEVKLKDIHREAKNTKGPIAKKLILHQVESGEVVVKFDLHMFSHK